MFYILLTIMIFNDFNDVFDAVLVDVVVVVGRGSFVVGSVAGEAYVDVVGYVGFVMLVLLPVKLMLMFLEFSFLLSFLLKHMMMPLMSLGSLLIIVIAVAFLCRFCFCWCCGCFLCCCRWW